HRMKHCILFLCLCLCLGLQVSAQLPDSLRQSPSPGTADSIAPTSIEKKLTLSLPDSSQVATADEKRKLIRMPWLKNFFDKSDYPNPKKAFIMSAIIPGAGQMYNKKLWYIKVPVIYGGTASFVRLIVYNSRLAKRLETANRIRFDEESMEEDEFVGILDDLSLRREWNAVRKDLDLSYVGLVVFHFLQSAEAFVQAHLLEFDVSDDLSLRLEPHFDQTQWMGMQTGLGLNLRFKAKPKVQPSPFLTP
ncbi:MAG: DUF5683 domain-containing protein, partial [Bacteroidota bacterium]